MIKVQIAHVFSVIYPDGSRPATAELHARGEQLMVALLDLEQCNNDIASSATTSDGAEGVITAEVMVTAETEAEAFGKSLTIVRTAIHAIGGATPGWESAGVTDAEYQPRTSQLEYV